MKKKIAYVDFWNNFDPNGYLMTKYLKEICDFEVTDMEHADYIFYTVHGNRHWQAPDRAIKIFYTREGVVPDFNACDYAIGFEWMEYEDRYFRSPLYYRYPENQLMEKKHLLTPQEIKAMKTDFCSITVSNNNRDPIFKTLFDELTRYKRVDSGGLWQNNVGGRVADKLAFDRSHKFSIVCENASHSGYTTEKLVQAFAAGCIPIYWGDPAVSKVFNPKAFINVQEFPTTEALVEHVKKIDADDALYEQMLREPALRSDEYCEAIHTPQLKAFLNNIFQQPLEKAQRRNRGTWGQLYIENRRKQVNSYSYKLQASLHRTIWKFKQLLRRKSCGANSR
jgi:hypothetical protein